MVRYLVSLGVFFAGIVLTIFMAYGISLIPISSLLYFPSFIITVLLPFLFVSVLFGFKEMASSFSICFKKEPKNDKLMQALHFFKTYGKTTWIAGLISLIMGLILVLIFLEDKASIGPLVALALLSLFYCGIVNMAIIIPFTVFIKKHLKQL